MDFDGSWQKRLSDCVVGHKFGDDINIDVLKSQAALIKGLSEIKTENGSLLDTININNLYNVLNNLTNYNYTIDVKQTLDNIEKLKDLTIETEYGPKKVFELSEHK